MRDREPDKWTAKDLIEAWQEIWLNEEEYTAEDAAYTFNDLIEKVRSDGNF